MSNGSTSQNIIPDALLIALATLIGYMFVFAYELGYAIYFRIPLELIRLSILDELGVVLLCGILFLFALSVTSLFQIYVSSIVVAILGVLEFLGLLYIDKKAAFLIVTIAICTGILVTLIQKAAKISNSAIPQFASIPGASEFILYMSEVVFLLGLFFVGGFIRAMSNPVFTTIAGPHQTHLVVLSRYQNILVTAPFDKVRREIIPTFTIVPIDQIGDRKLQVENLGYMKRIPKWINPELGTLMTTDKPIGGRAVRKSDKSEL